MKGYLRLGMKAPAVVLVLRRLGYYAMQPDERIHSNPFYLLAPEEVPGGHTFLVASIVEEDH